MLLNARTFPQRLPRAFNEMTRLEFQVKTASTITIAREQGEAANVGVAPGDGVQLTQANTSPPWGEWWQGELWYASNTDNSPFVVLIIGRADSGGLAGVLKQLCGLLEKIMGRL